jgi:glycyl-tRNA synthetase beta chain
VNCLVEWPAAILCQFEPAFLRVPHEALVSTMQANQKFFPLREADGALSEYFIGIANIDSKDPAQIKQGYERVIRPRFADAAFFYDEDLKQGIAAMAEGLASVTYQQKLGSYADKAAMPD